MSTCKLHREGKRICLAVTYTGEAGMLSVPKQPEGEVGRHIMLLTGAPAFARGPAQPQQRPFSGSTEEKLISNRDIFTSEPRVLWLLSDHFSECFETLFVSLSF